MTISKSWFSYLTRAFALSLCTALLLSFVSCSDSSTSQEPKDLNSTYTVKHLLQNLADNEYTEDTVEQKTGSYGTQTSAAAKTYEGFTAKSFTQKTIQDDGSTVIEIYYDRNTYTVSYSSTYGEPPESKTIKYGYVLETEDLPVLSKTGYNFNGWVYENTSIEAGYIVKKDIALTAQWDEIIATYTVKHLLQNLADDDYTEDSTEQKSGTPGTQTAAAAKTYEGFTAKPIEQATIQADGSTVVEIHYDRNTYTLSYSSTYGDTPQAKTVKYGYELTAADLPDLTQTNYSFNGWLFDGASIKAGYIVKTDITLTAQWDEIIATYTVKHLLQNLQNDSYTEKATEQKSGKSGTQTVATSKSYEGFTAKSFTQATIQEDGSTVVEIYYDRNTYTISYSSTYGEPPESKTVKYGYVLTAADLPVLPDTVLSFNGWFFDGASIEAGYTIKTDITITAQWKAPASVTKENFSAVIAALTEDSTIVLTGELTDSDLQTLKIAINNSTYKVNLDLSQTTGLTSIVGLLGLSGCSKLSGITIPDSVTSIKGYAFYGCTALSSVTIPDSVTSIGGYAFYNCTSLSSVTIPDSVTSIREYAFYGCTALSSVTIPDSVTSIGSKAFYGCTTLSSVTIPDSVTSIGSEVFYGCSSLSSVTIPDSVTSIEGNAFQGCTSLSSVTIGNSVTTIGQSAFHGCTSLSSVTIPDSVTTIASYAFGGCTSLTTITVDSNNANYSSIDGVLFNKDATAIITYPTGKQSAAYTIPDSVTSIGNSAFADCTSLSSVTIPDYVTSIGSGAFGGCTSLSSVTIPDSVTSIGSSAFYDCTSLSSVTISDSVTSIDTNTFYGCSSLSSVTIPDSVTSIGRNAFSSCRSLSSVTIGDSVTSISTSAFESCISLSSVTIGESVTSIGPYAFRNCTSLSSVTIPDSVTSIGNYAFEGCFKLTSITFIDTTYWYTTKYETDWNNKTAGTYTSVSYPTQNAAYFTSTYYNFYWYKLDE